MEDARFVIGSKKTNLHLVGMALSPLAPYVNYKNEPILHDIGTHVRVSPMVRGIKPMVGVEPAGLAKAIAAAMAAIDAAVTLDAVRARSSAADARMGAGTAAAAAAAAAAAGIKFVDTVTPANENLIPRFTYLPTNLPIVFKWDTYKAEHDTLPASGAEHSTLPASGAEHGTQTYISFNPSFSALSLPEALAVIGQLKLFNHPNICKVLGLVRNPNPDSALIYGIMWVIENGWIGMNARAESLMTDDRITMYVHSMGEALNYIHCNGFVHTNFKPDIVMTNETVSGFKMFPPVSIITREQGLRMTGQRGSPLYMCIAIVRAGAHITHQSDVYSFAVSVAQLVTKKPPYNNITVATFDKFYDMKANGTSPFSMAELTGAPFFHTKPSFLGVLILAMSNKPYERPPLGTLMSLV
jgi:hypothetical protein